MKAIVYTTYGAPEVLSVAERTTPTPQAGEVRIRVHAVSVNFGDSIARRFKYISPAGFNMPMLFWLLARVSFGWNKPKKAILGNSFSGTIEALGNGATRFKKGDAVFGYVGENMGACAEYLCMPENGILAPMPSNTTMEEASCIPYSALMAFRLLKKANIQPGQRVLILGAAGGIGSAAVQLAKNTFGAEVSGVCSAASTRFVKSLGADRVLDYHKEDFTQDTAAYDLIFDVLGKSSFSRCKSALRPKGIYFSVSFKLGKLLQMLWTSIRGGKKVVCTLANPTPDDLQYIRELVEAGKFRAVIDQSFPMEQAAAAHRYFEDGNRKGHVVISLKDHQV